MALEPTSSLAWPLVVITLWFQPKPAELPGSTGINTVDVVAEQNHALESSAADRLPPRRR